VVRTELAFGKGTVSCELPGHTLFPPVAVGGNLPLATDLAGEVRRALAEPLDTPPLRELAPPGGRVTVAFDDPCVAQYGPLWSTAVPLILAELEAGGVRRDHIRLLCANALHRKFTPDELATLLGRGLVVEFGERLSCHDAEDPDRLVHLGTTANGLEVELNRAVVDDDLTVYLNCSTMRAFSGGWKSICVGLSTYRSIRAHHNPDDMSMSFDRNRMHAMLNEMGAHVTSLLGPERIFKLETVQANPLQVSKMFAGSIDATRAAALELIRAHQAPRRALVDTPVDVVVYGLPDWSPYAAFSHTNPLLTLVSTGLGYLGGVIEAFGKPGCTVVLATPCPNRWDTARHPSYPEVWERVLGETLDPYEARARFESEFASRDDYRHHYRYGYGFHGVHAIMATFPLKRLRHAGRVHVAGAHDSGVVRHLGFEPYPTVEAAIRAAQDIHGSGATIACVGYPPMVNRSL
jgi:lactate racemase